MKILRKNLLGMAVSVLLGSLSAMVFCNYGFCQASVSEKQKIEGIVKSAIEGIASNDVDVFTKDFSKEKFEHLATLGPNKGKMQDYESFRDAFKAAGSKRLVVSASDIKFSDTKIKDLKATVLVEYSKSIISYENKEASSNLAKVAVSLEKTEDGWKIIDWQNIRQAGEKAGKSR